MKLEKNDAKIIARSLFSQWNEALLSGDPKKVSELYTKDNIFLPTMFGKMEFGREGDEEYFEHFLEKHPVGTIIQDDVIANDDIIVHAGLYDFELDTVDGNRETAHARFTFVYTKEDDGGWRIEHHHSSLKPLSNG